MKKALSLFLVALLVFSFSVFPAYAADGDEDPLTAINNIIALWDDPYGSVFPTIVADQGYYCFDWLNSQEFKDVWTVGSGNTGSAEFRSALGGNNLLLGKQYYTGGGGSFNGPGAGRVTRKNTGSTVKIPVISYTSNTTYFNMPTTTYNTTTNNYYNQYEVNNITYNSTYNVYNVQTTENNYYITYSPTYVTVTNFNHVDKSVSTEELYYKTPDGRNSFYCLASDMEGVTYLYHVKNAEMGLEDDGKTLGLWHLDGNFYDSSNWGHSAAAPSFQFDTAGWNGSFKYYYNSMQTGTQYIEFPYNSFSSLDYASLEFRMYVAPNSIFDMTVVVCELFSAENINFWLQAKKWNTVKILYDVKNNKNTVWVNGQIVSPSSYIEGPIQVASLKLHFKPSYVRFLNLTSKPADYLLIDEVRVSNFDVPVQVPTQPFDSNMAYIYPETAEENDIVLASSLPVSSYRVGGVRQTYPLNGDVFINVDNNVVKNVFQYDGGAWKDVDAAIYRDGEWNNLLSFDLNEVQDDVDGSGDGGGDGGSSGGEDSGGDSLWDKIVDGISSVLGGIADLVASVALKLLDSISSLISSLIESFTNLMNFGGEFGNFLAALWPFMPPEITAVLLLGVTLSVLLMVIGFFKK